MQPANSMKLDQLLDPRQLEQFLHALVELVPVTLHVEGSNGKLLAQARSTGVRSNTTSPPPERLHRTARAEARVPVEVHGERIGQVVAVAADPEQIMAPLVESAARLVAHIVADQAYKEHELNSLSTELLDKYEEITLLYDLSQALGSIFDISALCNIALEKAAQAVPAAKGFVMLKDEDSQNLTVVAARVDGLVGWKTPVGVGISGRVAESGKPILLLEGEQLPSRKPEEQGPRDAVLSVPLVLSAAEDEEVLGVITLAGKPRGEMFTAGDAKLLRTIATQLAIAIHNSRLLQAQREAERVRQEMEIAARIQHNLLPDRPPGLPGIEVAGRCLPATNVGGDYYDYLVDREGRLNLIIADVSGHNIGAALMMVMARSLLRREIGEGKSPASVLARTNTALLHDLTNSELFITMFCARYDPATRCLTFANGGHNPPLLRRSSDAQIVELDGDGMIVGILEDVTFQEQTIALEPGDLLLLYTDGIVEARNPEGEQFGDGRLRKLLTDGGALPPDMLADRIYAATREHSRDSTQQDDITLLILKVE